MLQWFLRFAESAEFSWKISQFMENSIKILIELRWQQLKFHMNKKIKSVNLDDLQFLLDLSLFSLIQTLPVLILVIFTNLEVKCFKLYSFDSKLNFLHLLTCSDKEKIAFHRLCNANILYSETSFCTLSYLVILFLTHWSGINVHQSTTPLELLFMNVLNLS